MVNDVDFEEVFLDSTIVCTHLQSVGAAQKGPQAIGRSHPGLTTKIHVLVEGLGNLTQFVQLEGQVHDSSQAVTLLDDTNPQAILADKAFDPDELRRSIANLGAKAVIPPSASRNNPAFYNSYQYKNRDLNNQPAGASIKSG